MKPTPKTQSKVMVTLLLLPVLMTVMAKDRRRKTILEF